MTRLITLSRDEGLQSHDGSGSHDHGINSVLRP
jgi:hypothetical protein